MVYYPERRVSKAAAWARRLAVFSAVLFASAAVGHRLGWIETPGLFAVLGVVKVLAAAALLFAARGFSRLWNHGDVGGRNLVVAVLIAAMVLAPFVAASYRALTHPQLTDVSTDLEDPPALSAAMKARTGEMNAILPFTTEQKRLQLEKYPQVTGRRYDMPVDRVLEAVGKVLDGRGWQIGVAGQPDAEDAEVTIEAVALTMVLALPADVAVRVTDEGTSTYVDMRSASRYGSHDLGDNAARIAGFLAELDAEVSAMAGVLPPEPAEGEGAAGEPAAAGPPLPEPRPQD